MVRIALRNKKGGSLIELLISMGILAIVAAALMKSSVLVLQKNVQNEMRDEAVRIAEQCMNEVRTGPGGFDGMNAVAFPAISRNIRSVPVQYAVNNAVANLDTNTKQVTVTVTWNFRGVQQPAHSIVSIARRYGQ